MLFKLSAKSLSRLSGVHPKLQDVVKRAIALTPVDFVVIEGLRTKERQAYLVEKGASKTMNSRHITGHAVDIAPIINGKVSWEWKDFYPVIDAMRQAAKELDVPVVHGADWTTFKDGPHHELDRHFYP